MDIEPLWAIGGWFSLSNCMAEPKSSSPISEPCSKSPSFLHFLTLFFVLLLLINLSHQPHPSTMASLESTKASSESTMSTTAMHPQNSQKSRSPSSKAASARREFGAEAHEVPSGPNPISN
ncbi:CLAVATA3/ESR (CLE)-related protein TDIF-like [Vigna umbellata]|uniref:CLAVATA3/ESR (CLE)-related protein TDIF-like n=1 Tax=Vigna umbellata TaxID=87088 RepID=UPI001F5E68FE|nr:CLAVATA3/ESR (CLE)-related protein TDIF-like [Vigna umbellata]